MADLQSSITILTGISCLLSICCVIFHAIAFGTQFWLQGDGISPFVRLGFHEACFDNCHDPWCPGGDETVIFNGCWWVYDYHFQSIWQWLTPDWFFAIRDITIGMIPLTVACLVLLCICLSLSLADRYAEINKGRDICLALTLFITAIVLLVTGILGIIVLAQFHINSDRKDWMPMPERNTFGYSFWLEFTVTIILLTSFLLTMISGVFKILDMTDEEKGGRYAEDMMLGRS